jgi:Pyruvate/2-oxoacid:ferredoxin oxidoreductase delta subunit
MNKTIEFNDIAKLFDDTWDVGYLSKEHLKRSAYAPVKNKFHIFGVDFTNSTQFKHMNNAVVLIKSGHTWDYSHYEQAIDILESSGLKGWYPGYTNYKHAAVHAALGVRAKNSLIYSFKFGFDCHIAMICFEQEIINYPDRSLKRQYGLWKHCEGCNDCIVNCPAKAIHYDDKEPPWIDSAACENFIFFGKHDTVPNVKDYWHKHVHPEIPQKIIDSIDDLETMNNLIGTFKWDARGYSYDGNVTRKDGKIIHVPHCRECTSQPRCSKWNGKYPYDELGE